MSPSTGEVPDLSTVIRSEMNCTAHPLSVSSSTMAYRSRVSRPNRSIEATFTRSPSRTYLISSANPVRLARELPEILSSKIRSHSPTASSWRSRFCSAELTRT